MKRVHRRLFRINDQISATEQELAITRAEFDYHRSINDDAQRDAAVGNYIDREEAGATAADVRRFEKSIANLEDRLQKLEYKRDRLMLKLPG